MNFSKLRTKRVIIPTAVAVAVLGVGGGFWASTASASELQGSERDRVAAEAIEAAGGGTAVDAETSDDAGEAYEVEVRMEDGTEVEITLDADLEVIAEQADDESDGDHEDGGDDGRDEDGRDEDERVLTDAERSSAEEAALEATGGGSVTEVEASDDTGVAYEVEVTEDDGTEWDVDLDDSFAVLSKQKDD